MSIRDKIISSINSGSMALVLRLVEKYENFEEKSYVTYYDGVIICLENKNYDMAAFFMETLMKYISKTSPAAKELSFYVNRLGNEEIKKYWEILVE